MTTATFEKLKLLCIAIPLALSACGGGSSPEQFGPHWDLAAHPVPDNEVDQRISW